MATGDSYIGRKVRYIGKNNPNIGIGTVGVIIAYHKKLGKGRAYSNHVSVKVGSAVFRTALPLKTWEYA